MSKIARIRALVQNGLYYLTEHAIDEAIDDSFDIFDIEKGILAGRIRRTWPHDGKYEIIGPSAGGRPIGIVCRITKGEKVRVITVYEDRPRK